MQQIPLNIALDQDNTFASFLMGKNQFLMEFLLQASRSGNEFVYLWGNQGSGKSHLLQAFGNQSESVIYIPLKEPGLAPEMLEGLESFQIVCIDDIDAIAGDAKWEEGIFHLYNRIKDIGNSLVISGNQSPNDIGISLNDLKSRLTAMTVFKIQMLSDTDKQVLLQQKAAAMGFTLGSEVAQFVLSRSSRDLHYLMKALDQLDSASLIAQRKITVPFVKDVLGL
ncbi:MAG: DnaA regulatory inactivator Hda [Gammaproteobacteria bacterium]|nr:DnaA regulatory inactivator Hda [Gammaproteobacteria bacterium]